MLIWDYMNISNWYMPCELLLAFVSERYNCPENLSDCTYIMISEEWFAGCDTFISCLQISALLFFNE